MFTFQQQTPGLFSIFKLFRHITIITILLFFFFKNIHLTVSWFINKVPSERYPPAFYGRHNKGPGAHLEMRQGWTRDFPRNHSSLFIKTCTMQTWNLQSSLESMQFKQIKVFCTYRIKLNKWKRKIMMHFSNKVLCFAWVNDIVLFCKKCSPHLSKMNALCLNKVLLR